MSINLQKKISVNKVIGGKPKIKEIIEWFGKNTDKKVMPLCRFFGVASGKKHGVTDFGEWTALTGQFRGINISTGETFDSGICFLPDVAQDLILGQLANGVQGVEFAFDIGVALDEDSATGYVYRATPLVQEEDNPISRLESKLTQLAALPAPEKPEENPAPSGKGKK